MMDLLFVTRPACAHLREPHANPRVNRRPEALKNKHQTINHIFPRSNCATVQAPAIPREMFDAYDAASGFLYIDTRALPVIRSPNRQHTLFATQICSVKNFAG